jgi:membrane peptidoglycan carboxypeptidase
MPINTPQRLRQKYKKQLRWLLILSLVTTLVGGTLLIYELRTSTTQSRLFARLARESSYALKSGQSSDSWYPSFGPYDLRLGYTRIPTIISGLIESGFEVTAQARLSQRFLQLARKGLYPPYQEKIKAGLTILDQNNTTIYSAYRPERMYDSFEAIPSPVIQALLYIENREILNQTHPFKNPAVEWDRFALAIFEKLKQVYNPDLNAPGGSTIATQLEKYRHSKEGRTGGIKDKLLQMASASLRAYMHGRNTLRTRRFIIQQYINSIPLAALRGYGEVNGLGDGLWAWYGVDFEEHNDKLRALASLPRGANVKPYAESYKQMLSLFIAHRRPSFYLIAGLKELNALTDTYLDLLAKEGTISEQLRDACKAIPLTLRRAVPKTQSISFVQRKAANAIRTRLLQLLKYPQLYDLDQVDLTVKSTMNNNANEMVTDILRQIKDEESVKRFGLSGARNLDRGDPSKVIYSLTLYEHVGDANLLRVQTDNFENPFSVNEGARLDLGSTAKLRTLTTYLDIVGDLYDHYSTLSVGELRKGVQSDLDPISKFVAETFARNPKTSLDELLELALARRYSASPYETFFTGGGVHTFENFKKEDNGKNPTLGEALTHSLNLPFIRLMRDISRYYINRISARLGGSSSDRKSPLRMHFLSKFADQEGSYFMRRFHEKHRERAPQEVLPNLVTSVRASARHAAVMFRYVRPEQSLPALTKFLQQTVPQATLSEPLVEKWYNELQPGKFNLNDTGFLARVHPLELWTVRYLQDHPRASIRELLDASKDERQQVYEWLFKTPHTRAQDIRIRTLMETESFLEVHKQWKKVGYPFNSMVPSLASAIGSSGDRPIALAELVGIILNDGVRYPSVRLDELHFAAETPYEVALRRVDKGQGERVLKPAVARALKRAMGNVVEHGTARRVFQSYKRSDGKPYVIGGKTGTGDHRYETYGPGGQVLSSRVVNRTATFAFYIGDRFFGVISAHVPGQDAAKFDFTSALAAELLKVLSPSLVPMIERAGTELTPFESPHTKSKGTVASKSTADTQAPPIEPPPPAQAAPAKPKRKILVLPPPV